MPGIHFALRLDEREIALLADAAIDDAAQRLAARAFGPLPAGPGRKTAGDAEQTDALALLHALVHLQRAVDRQLDRAAEHAARAGAGYPDLGEVCNISRQGARRRWPGLVPSERRRPTTHRSRP
ncbi:hypothetical protein [Streptomyces specialis]|uniref:hypothetical protein n=1 Tax=Streptomyces specialis TaxID=498367 RepID=UPI00073F6725|nr:hypothetical protein [Streptomyces specialis]